MMISYCYYNNITKYEDLLSATKEDSMHCYSPLEIILLFTNVQQPNLYSYVMTH